MSLNKDTYNKIAKDWHTDHKNDDWWIEGTDEFVSHMKANGTILDVGCAGGFKSQYLINKGFSVVGIDISEEFIKIAKEEIPKGEFHVLEMENVRELGKTFDGILAQASLLHIEKKEAMKVLEELTSVLNIGGYFYISVKSLRPTDSEESVVEENDYGYSYKRFFSFYTMDELKGYFKKLDLGVVYENNCDGGYSGWLQIIGKKN